MSAAQPPHENTSKNTHAVVASLIAQRCAPGATILDLPCGEGAFTQRIMQHGFTVCAGDLEPRIRVPDAQFQQCDMNRPLPFKDHTFDAVACIDGIEHLERPFDFIRECARVIRNDGILIVSTPNISALRSRWRWLLTGFHNKGKTPLNESQTTLWQHIHLLSFPDLRYMLHTNGFSIETVRCNRIKPVSWLYALLVPLCALATAAVFRKEEKATEQRARNREILRQLFSPAVLFGETLIVLAVRTGTTATN